MVAGCISEEETPIPFDFEPVEEVEPTFVTFQSLSSETGKNLPISLPPSELMVAVSVEKNPIYNTITVRFDGGRGQDLVRYAIARVTFSDGSTDQKELMPTTGNTVFFEGTEGMDVVEVFVSYMNGESYKILNEAVGFIRPDIDITPVETFVTPEPVAPDDDEHGEPVTAPSNDLHISVSVSKDTVYKGITITFNGGLGQNLVQQIDVLVMLSDGSSFEYELEPRIGAAVVTDGTNGTDRVQVGVTYVNGDVYKIIDARLGSRGGIASN